MTLTSSQRNQLRALAHHLGPAVLVGKQGITDNLVRSVSEALEANELIKIKFNEFKAGKAGLIRDIAFRTNSEVVATVGHVAIFYRYQEDPEKRRIHLSALESPKPPAL